MPGTGHGVDANQAGSGSKTLRDPPIVSWPWRSQPDPAAPTGKC